MCQGSFGNVNKYKELVYLNADLDFDLFKQWQASQSRTDVPSGISYTLFVFCVEYIGKTIITNCFEDRSWKTTVLYWESHFFQYWQPVNKAFKMQF